MKHSEGDKKRCNSKLKTSSSQEIEACGQSTKSGK